MSDALFHCSGMDSLSSLQNNIPGEPGLAYPIYAFPPVTGFECNGRVSRMILWQMLLFSLFCFQTTGYYADPLSGCQAYHYCGFSAAIFGNIKWVGSLHRSRQYQSSLILFMNRETAMLLWYFLLTFSGPKGKIRIISKTFSCPNLRLLTIVKEEDWCVCKNAEKWLVRWE